MGVLRRSEACQFADSPGRRDFGAAGAKWRGQDDADFDNLRHNDSATDRHASIYVGGHDVSSPVTGLRAGSIIGLVPQEINLEPFERVINTVRFSRGLFGKKPDDAAIEKVLRQLSLWDKKDSQIRELSGGMKRRVLIAKALAHDPRVLFLDEPTGGVDVELRKDMWEVVAGLKADGVTIILTTHYIEEAEAIADRVGVIAKGELLLVEDKDTLMGRMGQKELEVQLTSPIDDPA